MSSAADEVPVEEEISVQVRNAILEHPEAILSDEDVMRALVNANDDAMGQNVFDLRSIAMEQLQNRLDHLEDTHRTVIATAYENLVGTNQVHRAILRLLSAQTFEEFLSEFENEVSEILRVGFIRIVIETPEINDPAVNEMAQGGLAVVPRGFVNQYALGSRHNSVRKVILRQAKSDAAQIYGKNSDLVRSEACLILDLGEGKLPAMLVMGSEDAHQFSPKQGIDLLLFFAGVIECIMRRWLD